MPNNTINSDLIRGHIDTIILRALYEGDRYGYDIIKEIEQKSGGRYQIKQPTLYSCLKRLEDQGFASSYWGAKSMGGRKKYYTLTDTGREIFLRNQNEWKSSKSIIDMLVSDGGFSFDGTLSEPDRSYSGADNIFSYIAASDEKPDRSIDIGANGGIDRGNTQDGNPFLANESSDSASATGKGSVNDSQTNTSAFSETQEDVTYELDSRGQARRVQIGSSFDEDKDTRTVLWGDDASGNFKYGTDSVTEASQSYVANLSSQQYSPKKTDNHAKPADHSNYHSVSETVTEDEEPETPYELLYLNSEPFVRIQDDKTGADATDRKTKKGNPGDSVAYKPDNEPCRTVYHADGSHKQKEEDNVENNGFLTQFIKYNTESPERELSDEEIVERDYQSALSKLVRVTKKTTPPPSLNEKSHQQVKLNKLAETTRNMGDKVIVRNYDDSIKQYNSENYIYRNRLMLWHYMILLSIMLAETLALLLINRFVIKANKPFAMVDLWIYISAAIVELMFPLIAFACAAQDYNYRKRKEFNMKASVLFRVIIMVQLWVIIGAVNVYIGILHADFTDFFASLVLPAVLSLNVIISLPIYTRLLKWDRFKVKN